MPLKIIRADITKMKCDAIVDPTDPYYSHGGGVDAQIHEAAGEELFRACLAAGELSVGHAVITPAFRLPAKHVIHTVGPRWNGGNCLEETLLTSCYTEVLKVALENGCKSLAVPLISSGAFGFPKDRVLRIAMDAIGAFLMEHEMLVYIVVYDKQATAISLKLFLDVQQYVDDAYVNRKLLRRLLREARERADLSVCADVCYSITDPTEVKSDGERSIEELLGQIDESFSEMLLRKIDESGMSDAECYKKANIDRKLFSKIRSDKEYRPSKSTVLAFAIALRLSLTETREMLAKAGFALSHSSKFDIIVEYFIVRGQYDLFAINETLLAFDQKLLVM